MKTVIRFVFIYSLIFLCSGCKDASEIKESVFYNFDDQGMKNNFEFIFQPFETIPSGSRNQIYDISIELRYSNKCILKSLPLNVEFASLESDTIFKQRIIIPLFDDEDNFQGKGNFGVFEANHILMKNQPFEDGFYINITTPEADTHGILALGVTLRNQNYKKINLPKFNISL